MTERQKELAFLKHLILFDDTDEHRELEARIAQVQRDGRCVRRAALLMALIAVLGAVGLAYGAVFQKNFPYGESGFVTKLICELGLASLFSSVALAGLLMAYRKKLNRLREQCRRLVTKLLEHRLGEPHVTPLRNSHPAAEGREDARSTGEFNGSRGRPDSLQGEWRAV